MIYKINEKVIVSKRTSLYNGKEGTIVGSDHLYDRYMVEFESGSIFTTNDIEWFDEDEIYSLPNDNKSWQNTKPSIIFNNSRCNHKWKSILLLTTTVFNCQYCGLKKEDYDNNDDFGVPF